MKSKFSLWGYFPMFVGVLFVIGFGIYITLMLKEIVPTPSLKALPLLALLSFTMVWLFWGECRTKMIRVNIDGNNISVKRFGGIGKKVNYKFSEFDGFTTSKQPYGARGILEFLYIIKAGRKIIKISEAYHKNYADLKTAILLQAKDLGCQNFNFIDEFREIFL